MTEHINPEIDIVTITTKTIETILTQDRHTEADHILETGQNITKEITITNTNEGTALMLLTEVGTDHNHHSIDKETETDLNHHITIDKTQTTEANPHTPGNHKIETIEEEETTIRK